MNSREISLFAVYEFLAEHLGDQPHAIPGTPTWCQLDDTDPDKWQAALWAAMWWAVAEDARQTAMAEASRAVAGSADWSKVGRPRPAAYIPRVA